MQASPSRTTPVNAANRKLVKRKDSSFAVHL
jgi:hypothetical protein